MLSALKYFQWRTYFDLSVCRITKLKFVYNRSTVELSGGKSHEDAETKGSIDIWMTWIGQHWDFWGQQTLSSPMPKTMVPTWEIVPSFLDNPEGSLSSFLETEIGSMISLKTLMARFMAAVYASPFCAMSGMEPSHWLFVLYLLLLQLQPDFWREVFLVWGLWHIKKEVKRITGWHAFLLMILTSFGYILLL